MTANDNGVWPFNRKEKHLIHTILTFISLALLLAVTAFIRERKLRLALQRILNRLLNQWRRHAENHNRDDDHPDRHRLSE
jgi:hypothetical protein